MIDYCDVLAEYYNKAIQVRFWNYKLILCLRRVFKIHGFSGKVVASRINDEEVKFSMPIALTH